jgi:hypothetical protein
MLFYMIFVIIIFLILLIVLIICKNNIEKFNIRLEKAHGFYVDYRNFIDGLDHLLTKNRKNKRIFPYKISPSCFSDKFVTCKNKKSYCNNKISNRICEDDALNQCVLPAMISE